MSLIHSVHILKVEISENDGFNLKVSRKDGSLIMNAMAQNFIYADQFLQISFNIYGYFLYGLGEHRRDLAFDLRNWNQVAMWARDQPPCVGCNLYGSHPMYISIGENGLAHGVVLMNRLTKMTHFENISDSCKEYYTMFLHY